MTYAQITPPIAEPLTLAEVRAHLRLDDTQEDALLSSLIATAREHLERETGLCLMAQAWRLYLDDWPADGIIRIAKSPVQAIQTVTVLTRTARRFTFRLKIIFLTERVGRRGSGCAIRLSPDRR
nr:bacteriophage protein [Rhizobium sp. Khangiran2]